MDQCSRAINSCLLSAPAFPNKSLGIFLLAGYAAAAIGADRAGRSGSYTSPLTHNRCSKTASFRATAIAARFFAFFPPRSHSRNPYRRKSVSGPNGPNTSAVIGPTPFTCRSNAVCPYFSLPSSSIFSSYP